MLLLLQGPAGGGKSQVYRNLIESGAYQVVADFTSIYVALTQVQRNTLTGLYPVRRETDRVIQSGITPYVKVVVVRQALAQGLNTIVTTSRRGDDAYWEEIATQANTAFEVRTVDPGESVVRERLANAVGELDPECENAISRWYR